MLISGLLYFYFTLLVIVYLLHSDFPSLTGNLKYINYIVIIYHMIWQYESTHPQWKFTDEHIEQIRVYICLLVCLFLTLSHGRTEVPISIQCWFIGMYTIRGLSSVSLYHSETSSLLRCLYHSPWTVMPFPISYGTVHSGWYKAPATLPLHMAVTSESCPDKFFYVSLPFVYF